ncbi:MAG: hypothetical protein JRI47_10120, partial [Deltaproteobacteria bacterium]|nr:hypothetical protein [Deltaproteobacteria bacterium]
PYFLIELTLEFLAGRLTPVATPQDFVPIPLSIRQVLDRRLSQLSPDAERVLGALAVHSRSLKIQGLARIIGLSVPKCLSGLDQLDEFRLVTHRGAEMMISHELVRHTVYQGLTESRRTWLHDQIARHILRSRKPVPTDELAVHFHQAGASKEARQFAVESAGRAEASGAIPEALRFLRNARQPSSDPEAVADLIGKMGHLHYLHQNLEEAAPLLELAAQRFRRQGKQDRALEAEVERIDCMAQRSLLPIPECLEELQRGKTEAQHADLWGTYTKALDVEVHWLDHSGNREGVERVLAEAQECSDRGGPDAQCRARAILALNVSYGSPKKGIIAAREAVEIALQTTDADLQLHALNRLIVVLLYQGMLHSEEGVQAFDLAEACLARSGDLNLKFFIKLNRAVGFLEIGELDRARAAFGAVEPVIKGTNATNAHSILFLNQGELGLASFDIPAAQKSYSKAESYLLNSSPTAFRTIINSGLGLCALHSGDLGEARSRENELPAADRLLLDVTKDVKGRFVTAWIKLSLERAKNLRKDDPIKANMILKEALQVALDLGLEKRADALRRLLDSL